MIHPFAFQRTWPTLLGLLALPAIHAAAFGAEPRAPLGAELPAYVAPDGDPTNDATTGEAPTAAPRDALTLGEALAAALLHNPALAANSWEIRSREARTIQAGLMPNPNVELEVENIAGSGQREEFEQAETSVYVSQLVPIGGKRAARRSVAELGSELARWDYEVARVDVMTDTAVAFAAALGAQLRVALLDELAETARSGVDTLDRLVRAGAAPLVTRTRAEVVLHSVALEKAVAQRDLATSRYALASLWGATAPGFDALRGDLAAGVTAPPPLAEIARRIDSNPDVARWVDELAARRAGLTAARAQRLPDPTLRLGGRHFSDTDDAALVFSVSLPIPVFDRNQGEILAAARDVEKARAEQRAARLAVRTALAGQHQNMVAAFEQAEALRTTTLPAAGAAFEGTREGYQKGLFQYLDVLDAQRTLYQLRTRQIESLVAYHQARAQMERLLGAPLREEADR